jgi:RimK-like ATP-grasp domain
MGLPQSDKTRRIAFVSRSLTGESRRSAGAITQLDGVHLFAVCQDPPHDNSHQVLADWVCLGDVRDLDQLVNASLALAEKHGSLDQIVTTTETLLEPVARANEVLGLRGMGVSTVRRTLDKSLLKSVLARTGINTARGRVLTSHEVARRFVDEVGFPVVLKPLQGSGGLASWCIRDAKQLELALELIQPSLEKAVLAEDYLVGQELCIDTITIANEPRFHSICYYRPSILEALENPRIQWSCVMPRDTTGERYQDFIRQGLTAVRALSVGNAMTHMEGFLLREGGLCFVDATLRPAGARIAPMLAFAYDIDPYLTWARAAVDGCFDGPWERNYAVGTVFIRGTGYGLIDEVQGIELVRQQLGELLVEARWPRVGATKSASYTGDGYATIRHPETQVVEDALQWIAQAVNITYSQPELPEHSMGGICERWPQAIQYFEKQLNKPAWDDD